MPLSPVSKAPDPTSLARPVGHRSPFREALELAKMTWSPVLAVLGAEEYTRLDRTKYEPAPLEFDLGDRLIDFELESREGPSHVRWLSSAEVMQIHDQMINAFGGASGTLDEGKIQSALERARYSKVFGQDQYPTLIHKAASLMHDILLYHPFADGQKRTGLSSAFVFLGLNGYSLWSRDPRQEVHFAIEVAKGEHSVEEVAHWLGNRVAPPSEAGPAQIRQLLEMARPKNRICPVCRSFLPIREYRIECKRCGAPYEVVIRFAATTRSARGKSSASAFIGLRKGWAQELLEFIPLEGPARVAHIEWRRRWREGHPPLSKAEALWRKRFARAH